MGYSARHTAMWKKGFVLLAAGSVVITGLGLSGCGGEGTGIELPDPVVMFLNASPDSGAIEFKLNGEVVQTGLAYLGKSDAFIEVEYESEQDGGYDLTTKDAASDLEYDREMVVFARDTSNLIVALGIKGHLPAEPEKAIRHVRFTLDRVQPVGNKSRLVVIHAMNRAPGDMTPSIQFKNPGDNPQYRLTDIGYGSSRTLVVDSGTYEWEVRRQDADGEVIFATSTGKVLEPGRIYVVLVSGIESDAEPARQPAITFYEIPPR